ncbi:MAG: PLP-dependent aminotransferase family protein [Rudaea sp.]
MRKQPVIHTTQLNPDPDVVDLGVGQPQLGLLPLDLIRRAAEKRLSENDPSALQYGAEQGDGYFLLALADFLTQGYGMPVDAANLFVTTGASQGLDLLATLLTQNGDTIFVEEPSYFLALRIFQDHHLRVVGIPTDSAGILTEALEDALAREHPRFLYMIPTFQNPSGATATAERRARLAELSRVHDFTLIADEVYHLLYFDTPPPLPMAAYTDRGRIISLGSFSKILAPGLRLGWIQASRPVIEQLVISGLLDSSGGLNPFTSALVRVLLEEGWQQEHLAALRATYRARAAAMSEALRRELGGSISFQEPRGGYFFWLKLPEGMDADKLLPAAERHKVGFRAGSKFSSRENLHEYIRLCFAYYDIPQLVEGVARLRRAIEDA